MDARRTLALCGLVPAAVLALLAGVTPAVAEPVVTAAVTTDPPRPATQDDKVRAAQEIGVVASPELLILTDRNFVFALWQRASGTEVRASAELAYAGVESEWTQWIKTGVREANARDQAHKLQSDAAARAARENKDRAARVNGIVAPVELLIQSDKDFVFAMWQQASGPLLKEAALAAYNGSPADLKAFILTGIFAAREADQKAIVDADQQADAEEKARRNARDARIRAAAVVALVATEGHLVEPDVNFVMDLWDRAKPSSEVRAAAERALRSPNPADLVAYIGTGIHQANFKDWQAWLKKKGEADRRLAFELKTRADQSRVHPALVTAANAALAGTYDDVELFLRVGQYEDAVLTQSLRFSGDRYLRGSGDAVVAAGASGGDGADATWRVVPGKADVNCHSFESVRFPEHYLRQSGQRVVIAPSDGTDQFRSDATWCTKAGTTGTTATLESFTLRGRYLRQFQNQVWAANGSGQQPHDTATGYATDIVWQASAPYPGS
ncbi:AbfB domain-containing protein [Amycolatopsis sp. lyj-84]|uniref:AbfB domain-containing protein n=1 Tax=Amycolatopsis sp. lyj-84 TaxID=2789284 RepID=UPI00397C9878